MKLMVLVKKIAGKVTNCQRESCIVLLENETIIIVVIALLCYVSLHPRAMEISKQGGL